MSRIGDCPTEVSAGHEVEPAARSLRGRKFLWLQSPPWDNVWTRQNHFTIRLARLGAEILYVENPSAWGSRLRQKDRAPASGGAGGRIREVRPGLHVLRPAFHLPGSMRSDAIARCNGLLLAAEIRRWIRLRGWSDYTCWCRVPHSLYALKRLQPSVTVYDITDNYELYESRPATRRRVRERERELCARAGLVLISSRELQEEFRARGVESQRIPNGVEYDLFASASQPGPVHPLVAGLGRPLIGYVGLTSHWMDFQLLAMLGRRWPGRVLMLGPIAPRVEKQARSIPGVVWGGFVPQTELPPYLRGVDVTIMPHQVNALRRMSNPLKVWEYMATGKPFVSVDLPALDPARSLIAVARDRAHFLELVEEQLTARDGRLARVRQEAARAWSWDAIFARMLGELLPRLEAAHP